MLFSELRKLSTPSLGLLERAGWRPADTSGGRRAIVSGRAAGKIGALLDGMAIALGRFRVRAHCLKKC
jgi:hypothetical protein